MGVLTEIRDRLRRPDVNNEVLRDAYLETLSEQDRENIKAFTAALASPDIDFRDERVAVLAFGSSVRPPKLRSHPVEDIDLRVISSALPDSKLQTDLIQIAIEATKQFAEQNSWEYTYRPDVTLSHRLVQKPDIYFLDYDNNDPSFEMKPKNGGLPLHVSITGPGIDRLDSHILQERQQKQHFSILTTIQR
jgi:hypothetical protein